MSDRQTAQSSADIEKLTKMIQELLSAVWGADWGIFTQEHPAGNDSENMELPQITYALEERTVFEKRGVKPVTFNTIPDPEHEGHNISFRRMWFNCNLEFTVYESNNKEATRLAQRFEEFIEDYKGFFKEQGVTEMIFVREKKADTDQQNLRALAGRTIEYRVVIERITQTRSVHLQQVEAIIRAGKDVEETAVVSSTTSSTQTSSASSEFLDLYNTHFST